MAQNSARQQWHATLGSFPTRRDAPRPYSLLCFISYASKDHAFAERLHADLQNKGGALLVCPRRHENR